MLMFLCSSLFYKTVCRVMAQKKHRQVRVSKLCPAGQNLVREGVSWLDSVPLRVSVLVPVVRVPVVRRVPVVWRVPVVRRVPVDRVRVLVPLLLDLLRFSLARSCISLSASSYWFSSRLPRLVERLVDVCVERIVAVLVVPPVVVLVLVPLVPVLVPLVPVLVLPVPVLSVLSDLSLSSSAGMTSTHSHSHVCSFNSCKLLHSLPLVPHPHSQVRGFKIWALVQASCALLGQVH